MKNLSIAVCAMIVMLLSVTSAHAQNQTKCVRPSVATAAVMDTVTTAVVLHRGGYEHNPLGFANTILGKGLYFAGSHLLLTAEQREPVDALASAVWTGASINNIMVALGASNPISAAIGLVSMVWLALEHCPTSNDNKEPTNDTRNN